MISTHSRTARCACGSLDITLAGDPEIVVLCNCLACQARTGAPFGVGAYFRNEQRLRIGGVPRIWTRTAPTGRTLDNHFCGQCGTTVFWTLDMRPGHVGVAVGCFGDPGFAAPARAIWTATRHHWLEFPDDMACHEGATPAP